MNNHNDVIVRLTKDADGKISHEVLLGVNDDDMIQHLEEVAEKIHGVLNSDESKVVSRG